MPHLERQEGRRLGIERFATHISTLLCDAKNYSLLCDATLTMPFDAHVGHPAPRRRIRPPRSTLPGGDAGRVGEAPRDGVTRGAGKVGPRHEGRRSHIGDGRVVVRGGEGVWRGWGEG